MDVDARDGNFAIVQACAGIITISLSTGKSYRYVRDMTWPAWLLIPGRVRNIANSLFFIVTLPLRSVFTVPREKPGKMVATMIPMHKGMCCQTHN